MFKKMMTVLSIVLPFGVHAERIPVNPNDFITPRIAIDYPENAIQLIHHEKQLDVVASQLERIPSTVLVVTNVVNQNTPRLLEAVKRLDNVKAGLMARGFTDVLTMTLSGEGTNKVSVYQFPQSWSSLPLGMIKKELKTKPGTMALSVDDLNKTTVNGIGKLILEDGNLAMSLDKVIMQVGWEAENLSEFEGITLNNAYQLTMEKKTLPFDQNTLRELLDVIRGSVPELVYMQYVMFPEIKRVVLLNEVD